MGEFHGHDWTLAAVYGTSSFVETTSEIHALCRVSFRTHGIRFESYGKPGTAPCVAQVHIPGAVLPRLKSQYGQSEILVGRGNFYCHNSTSFTEEISDVRHL